MKPALLSLVLSVLIGCSGASGESAGPPAPSTFVTPPGGPATSASSIGPQSIDHPLEWDTAVEVPFVPVAPPAETVVIEDVLDEVVDLSTPIELMDAVLFAKGTAVITPEADAVLARLAAAAVDQLGEGQHLRVDGYVDELGTPAFNDQLGDDRAAAVVNRLIRHEPSLEGRVDGFGHGEDELLDPSCRGDCPANRKVVVRVTG